jgi:hypothetical protein
VPRGVQLGGDVLGGVAISVDDRDGGAGLGEGADGGCAHSGAASGDECRITPEIVDDHGCSP